MGHLTKEALARLVSESPSPEEGGHLEGCPDCKCELETLLELTESLGSLPDLRPPAGDWEALESRLVSEGLIRSSGIRTKRSRRRFSGWIQAAAALVLFFGGTAVGSGFVGPGADGLNPAGEAQLPDLELIPVGTQMQPVSNLTDAVAAVNVAEQQYMLALLQYRQLLDFQGQPTNLGDPTSRLAAIEAILAAGRAAIQQAPADPYVNGVLISALAEREAFLRTASSTRAGGIY